MPERELVCDIENNTEGQRKFLNAIMAMPESGITFRGDPLVRAKQLQGGLTEPQINFIVFKPPTIRPKIWGKEARDVYRQLSSAINMALVYADPWYDTGANTSITDPSFTTHVDYFANFPDKHPAITWFTEVEIGQFEQVFSLGRTWLDYDIVHHTGNISLLGIVPANNVQPTIVLEAEDIKQAQENLLSGGVKTEVSNVDPAKDGLFRKALSRLSLKKRGETNELLFRNQRKEFRDELVKIAMMKLCEGILHL